MNIPFGVVQVDADEVVDSIDEKPTITYLINSGVYVVSPEILDMIPESGIYPMTSLIDDVRKSGMKVFGFEFDDSWRDIGRLDDYIKAFNGNDEIDTTIDFDTK